MTFTDIWTINPMPAEGAVIRGESWRVTVLTDRLLRLEYEPKGRFCDTATQTVIDRSFPLPVFTHTEKNGWLTVETEAVRLQYDGGPFSPEGLSVTLKGQYGAYASVWHYGDNGRNLKGTARTLDEANGEIPLGDGLFSREGYAVLDDSHTMRMDESGNLLPAEAHGIDIYLFAYGRDFKGALRDFYHLTGPTPALPRYALGNWWSRFYPYTEATYMALMERFAAEDVPLSVAVIDMNWHVTDIAPKYGPGWTGYGWWSHDIGGHIHGVRDEELQTRWLQFGVLSPIMRLHACNSEFLGKEPWAYPQSYCAIMERWLRFRHALLPWLYTKNAQSSSEGWPMLYPVYYDWPDDEAAYAAQHDEYVFGEELLVAPVTSKMDDTGLASAKAWLPAGEWVDFTTGHRYPGGQFLRVYRALSEVPIFVRPGTVIPMDGSKKLENGGPLPRTLLFRVFAGASGDCHVAEDNGKAENAPDRRAVETRCMVEVRSGMTVMISPPIGDAVLIPENRRYEIELVGVENRLPDDATAAYESGYDAETRTLRLTFDAAATGQGVTLRWHAALACPELDRAALLQSTLLNLRMDNDDKDRVMEILGSIDDGVRRVAAWRCLDLPDSVFGRLMELETIE